MKPTRSTSLDGEGIHSVQVVARETGLSPDALRVWERRYSVVTPARSEGRHRLYTDAEVERLRLLAQVVRGGRRIKDVAGLATEELLKLARRDGSSRAPMPNSPAAPKDACLQAIAALDGDTLDAALARAASAAGASSFVESLVPELLSEIGRRWAHGTLSVAHEHLATVHVRARLLELLSQQQRPAGAPLLLATTPCGEGHELGALGAAVIAATMGWRAVFLGAAVPAEDVARAARQLGARAVALSIVHPEEGADIEDEVRKLVRSLDPGVTVLVGGPGAFARRGAIEDAGARVLDDFEALRGQLGSLPSRPSG